MATLARGGTIPTTAGNPLTGAALDLRRDFLGTIERGFREHGDVVRFPMGPRAMGGSLVGVFHPDGVREVLSGDRDAFHKDTPVNVEMRETLGDGVLTSEGQEWVRQRRTLQPLFTKPKVRTFSDVIVEEAAATADRWLAAPDGRVDLGREMTRYATMVVGRAIFGSDLSSLIDVFTDHVPTSNELTLKRAFNPLTMPRWVPTPGNTRLNRATARTLDVVDELIDGRVRTGERQEDLVSMLLDARDPETGEPLSRDEVRDQVLVILAAGHDTTATALAFALHLLGQHPEEQDAAAEEVVRVLGSRDADAGDERDLARIGRVNKEAMRLYPSAYVTGRVANRDVEVMGHHLPEGQEVIVSPWVTHRHPEFWDRPLAFDTDRFLPAAEKERDRYAWWPFGGGPRLCIGIHVSMLEQTLGLATILQRVAVRAAVDHVDLATGITLIPTSPIWAEVRPR